MSYPPSGYGQFEPPGPPPPPGAPGMPPPGYGYVVPAMAYGAADPLVTPIHEGFSGWFGRVFSVLGRSWRSLLLISLVTYALPIAVVVGVLVVLFVSTDLNTEQTTVDGSLLLTFVLILLVGVLVIAFAQGVAQAAAVWSVTREAAGHPRSLRGALGYGLRNGFRLFGWSLLYGLMILLGAFFCLIPGLYFALAGCMYVPIALYRRGMNPIGTSFTMIGRNLGAALGRMALLMAMLYGVQLVVAVPVQVIGTLAPRPVAIVLSIALQLVTAPLPLVPAVGSTLLFAELWNRQSPITTAHLDAAVAPTA